MMAPDPMPATQRTGALIQMLSDRLQREEGCRLTVYDDATGQPLLPGTTLKGHPTIGIGTNIGQGGGITQGEAQYILSNRILRAIGEASTLEAWPSLDIPRQAVLADMVFNMGLPTVRLFSTFLQRLSVGDYAGAAEAGLASRWAVQVGQRADKLMDVIKTGQWS